MMDHITQSGQVLVEVDARAKLRFLEAHLHDLLRGERFSVPAVPGRDVQIVGVKDLPPKKGVASVEGQARLLHDLASIELQAMELGLRTLIEFPDAPSAFRSELAAVTADEGRHFGLCLDALEELGVPWGSFAAHTGLWQCVSSEDSLLDRILIVHRYLEGSGLDASDKILRRLVGVGASVARGPVSVISRDEVGHVQFGSRWYHKLVEGDATEDFRSRLERLFTRIPRRLEPINVPLRLSTGFTSQEVEILQGIRLIKGAGLRAHQ